MAKISAIAQLLEAAGSGRLEEVKRCVAENPHIIYAKGKVNITVGHIAAFYGRCSVLRFLADQDTTLLYARTPDGGTLAHSAAANGCCEALQFLAEVDIGLILGVDSDGWTAAHSAAYYNQQNALTFLTKASSWLVTKKNAEGLVPGDVARIWVIKAEAEARAEAEAKAKLANTNSISREKSAGAEQERASSRGTDWGNADAQIDVASAEQEGKWKALLKGLRKGSDITNMLIPVDFIRPESSLERVQDIMQRPRLLEDVARPRPCALQRMLAVVRFQLSSIIKPIFDGKKPYNPVLGETCAWAWQHPEGRGVSRMVTEQVSHHPPISAVHLSNEALGVSMHGFAEIVPKFTGNSVLVPFKGQRVLTLHNSNEQYLMTYLPNLQYRGLLIGSRGAEWTGRVSIRCEKTQLEAKLSFKALGMLGMWGGWHRIEGSIVHTDKNDALAGTIAGRWDEEVRFTGCALHGREAAAELLYHSTTSTSTDTVLLYHFGHAAARSSLPVSPTPAAILPTDSTVVWRRLTKSLKEGDLKTAAKEKRAVEQRQRQLASVRKQRHQPFQASFFRLAPPSSSSSCSSSSTPATLSRKS